MTLAALPMYDFEELRWATDALWAAIATRLGVTGSLMRDRPLEDIWLDPDLLLAQTCGYPLMTSLAGKVELLATPRYNAPGCEGAFYRSAIVVHATDDVGSLGELRGRRCALNDSASNSGMNLLRAAVATVAGGTGCFFSTTITTGSHVASLRMVAHAEADVAAIDCVTWALLQRLRPNETKGLRVLAWTEASPGLPLITSIRTGANLRLTLVRVLNEVAMDAALAGARQALLLQGFEAMPRQAYASILDAESRAQQAGYPILC